MIRLAVCAWCGMRERLCARRLSAGCYRKVRELGLLDLFPRTHPNRLPYGRRRRRGEP